MVPHLYKSTAKPMRSDLACPLERDPAPFSHNVTYIIQPRRNK